MSTSSFPNWNITIESRYRSNSALIDMNNCAKNFTSDRKKIVFLKCDRKSSSGLREKNTQKQD